MRLGLFVNDCATEKPQYTTTRLALAAAARGHEVWYLGAGDFVCDTSALSAHAMRVPPDAGDRGALLEDRKPERIAVDDLDVLWLRNDPADDVPDRAWAQTAGILFGGLAARRGVQVLNDPVGLGRALSKLYLHHFPPGVHPNSLVTRDPDDVRAFVAEHGGRAVIKPLQGSGGHGVFVVQPEDEVNLGQMIESVTRDGYLICQEYLPPATEGDVRLFLLDGEPLREGDVYAAFRRVPAEGEARSNMRTGGTMAPAEVDDDMLRLAAQVGPQLVEDGMFFVGLDIVDGRLLEINVFSPGGLGSVQATTGVDFTGAVLDAVERRVNA